MKRATSLLFISLLATGCWAQNALSFYGYVKYMQTNFVLTQPQTTLLTDNLLHNRLNLHWYPHQNWEAAVEMRNRAFYGEYTKSIPHYGDMLSQDPGFFDLSFTLVDKPYFILHSTIDRAFVHYTQEKWNLRLGRQRINWGINSIWNPNDYFNTFNFFDFDYEERPGVDALKFQYYTDLFSSLELAIAPGNADSNWVGALKYRTNVKRYDVQIIGAWYNQDVSLGLGWAGNLKTAGFKGEMGYFHPRKNLSDTSGSFTGSVTLDYTFNSGWYTALSLLYVGNGATQPIGTGINFMAMDISPKQLMPTRYTMALMASKSVGAAGNLSLATMFAPGTNMLIVFPTFTYNMSEQFDLDFVAQTSFTEQQKDFVHGGSAIFGRLKWSF